jgi:hypothetical protein
MPAVFVTTWLNVLRQWVDDHDLSDDMLLSWVAMAEERFNNELRVAEMVQTRTVDLTDQCVPLPDDFLEMILCSYTGSSLPLRYISPDEHTRLRSAAAYSAGATQTLGITYLDPVTGVMINPPVAQPAFIDYPGRSGPTMATARNTYTFIGHTLYVNPTVAEPTEDIDPTGLELSYYGMVPPLADATVPTPLFVRSPKLYLYTTLAQSAPFLVEDSRAQVWDANATNLIQRANEASLHAHMASSPIVMQVRSFG